MLIEELRGAVLAVPGIADATVEPRLDHGPAVRVWLDGSRSNDDVSGDLSRVLAAAGYAPRTATPGPQRAAGAGAPSGTERPDEIRNGNGAARRAGLGRGLGSLIPAAEPEFDRPERRLEMISIEESASGTVVRAVDASGRSAVASVVNDRSLNAAVAATVAGLLGYGEPPTVRAVEVRELAGSPVLVVVVDTDRGSATGSALIESGMPFALGSALWAALRDLP